MLTAEEYTRHDAIGLADLRAAGEVTARELLQCALDLAARDNPRLNAIVYQAHDEAQKRAAILDKENTTGLLAGVPFLIKEVNAVRNWPHTRSTKLLSDQVAATHSAAAARYLEGGLVPFGSTNTPELCLTITTEFSLFGPCHNPHNLSHTTGGSSGGSAAAVAAGIVPAADGSDGGGSIRIPAACCGLIGHKPSRGLTVVEPDMGSAWSGLSVSHVVSRSVRDSAAFLDLLKLKSPDLFALPNSAESFFYNHTRPLRPLKIGIQRSHPAGLEIHQDCLTALDNAAKACENQGHHLIEATPPINYNKVGQAMSTLINIHVAQIIAAGLQLKDTSLDQAGLAESTRRMAARGMEGSAAQYLNALDTLKQAERQMALFHEDVDVILSPVLALPPAELGWLDMNAADIREYAQRYSAYSPFTALYNGTGQPSISLPLHKNAAGLPIGVMFSAAWGADLLLLQLAHSLIPGIVPVAATL